MRRVIVVIAAIVSGCIRGDVTEPQSSTPPVRWKSITVAGPNTVELGSQTRFQVTVLDMSDKTVRNPVLSWTSSDHELAAVTDDGMVNAYKEGYVTITAGNHDLYGRVTVQIVPASCGWDCCGWDCY